MKIIFEQIKQLIAEPYLSRGKKYASNKDVRLVTIEPKKVTAKVAGSFVYKVTLVLNGSLLQGSCTLLCIF